MKAKDGVGLSLNKLYMSGTLRAAKISFKNRLAGRLEETTGGGTRFSYHESWRETIACCLPIARREHEWRQGLHPFFQHLGAEGWLRQRQARITHVAEEDDLGLLLKYGADCIGAVGVLPAIQETHPTLLPNEVMAPGRTVSGVQRKLLVMRDQAADVYHPAAATGPAPYIAKFNSEARPTLVRNESLCLRWTAALLGAAEVTAFEIGDVAELDELALIVTRFDRMADGEKLRAEDFAQILCKPRGADFGGKYEASYEEAAEIIRAYSARPEIDLTHFFRRLIAFALVANGDAHLKNFTLLERPEGLRLSPIYDVVNVGVYAAEGVSQRFALAIGGAFVAVDALTRPLLTAFGERIGLPKSAIESAFRDLKSRARRAKRVLPNPDEGRDEFGARFTEIVRNACLRLLEE
jgi:serine/threonine-protein kinase HipA